MADITKFNKVADRLSEFISDFESLGANSHTEDTLEIHSEEIKELWATVKKHYSEFLNIAEDVDSKTLKQTKTLKAKYQGCYQSYFNCLGTIRKLIREVKTPKPDDTPDTADHPSFHVPPCDMEVFTGEYLKWPTFRDLFAAVYVNNKRVSKVEKLFYLNSKTAGEAKEIVAKAPLTNDGFDIAWNNLIQRYENKRILVNGQLRVLFNLPVISVESGEEIKRLQSAVNNSISALKLHNIDVNNWDCILTYLCSIRLPELTLSMWEQSLKDKNEIPSWKEFDDFLTSRYKTLETVCDLRASTSQPARKSENTNFKNLNVNHVNISSSSCRDCNNHHHTVRTCPKFLKMNVTERTSLIRRQGLCMNCFSKAHSVKNCHSIHNCFTCNRRHHTLLHPNEPATSRNSSNRNPFRSSVDFRNTSNRAHFNDDSQAVASNSNRGNFNSNNSNPNHRISGNSNRNISSFHVQDSIQPSTSQQVNSHFAGGTNGVLLGTAVVQVYHLGNFYPARALIDSGSEGSFISDRFFKLLKIQGENISANISGLNDGVSAKCTKMCSVILRSRYDSAVRISANMFVIPKVTSMLPSSTINISNFNPLPDIQLADSEFYVRSNIDLLIGSDLVPEIMKEGVRHNICGSLLGQETVFGWILSGPVVRISSFSTSIDIDEERSLEKSISKFWEMEELPRKPIISAADQYCEEYYKRTTRRDSDGRYVVCLPFKEETFQIEALANSRSSAFAQFLRNEARLLKLPNFKVEYDRVLQEYLDMDHMHIIHTSRDKISSSSSYYLPHHAVIKPESTSTKLRVVFNASSPSSNGKSLNDILHTGPVLQLDLTLLLLRWRIFRYVFNADIEKMYRQIRIDSSQHRFQRLLYRNSPTGFVQDYELSTVTFGVNCAPYLAIRTLHQLADDVHSLLPRASEILRHYMYVDDILAGAHNLSDAFKAKEEVRSALESAGFQLRKWTSNSKEILSNLPVDHILNAEFLEFEDTSVAKTLGIRWNAQADKFYFSAPPLSNKDRITKRDFLSQISKLFDPAGWLSPCIVIAKMLMQKVWLEKVDWDNDLPEHLFQKWQRFLEELPNIQKISVPRWVGYSPEQKVQFHVFCDASEKAFAATIYIRIASGDSATAYLLTAKSRVAPVKTISLPRLELCGAVLAAEMASKIIPELRISYYDTFFWTDSTIVLAWLRKPPCSWSTFVANRVTTILECVGQANWFHVDTNFNPADLATRGILPSELISNSLWWNGPEWLCKPQVQWPYSEGELLETDVEKRSLKVNFTYFSEFEDILERFSEFSRALRVMSYVFRFISRCRFPSSNNQGKRSKAITREESHFVKRSLIIQNQKAFYPEEYRALSRKETISKTSSLINFNPFLDANGLMRVSGRLAALSSVTYDERHPIILPYNCQFTRLLVQFTHKISLHGDNELLLRLIRLQFAIPKVKNLIKATIHRCKICVIQKQKLQSQLMGELPEERTTMSRPFATTGVDFAGPFDVRTSKVRNSGTAKAYVSLFICFATRAIHLEAVSDLSTEGFLAAFSRFVARRGCPNQLFSDNGRNFVGASRAIAEDFLKVSQEKIEKSYQAHSISWKFIPPGAPHMGGLWEAGVKSFKKHFRKVAENFKFTFEEFTTLLSKIEACLNSRPISVMSENPDDPVALTPGHFLIGAPLLAPAEPEIQGPPITLIRRWQRLKALHQQFSRRWKDEYLQNLQKRSKWKVGEPNVEPNSIVVIREDNLPPNEWRLGKIESVVKGKDDKVRVANIKTKKGIIRRPICKLVILPCN